LVEGRCGGAKEADWFGYTPNYLPVRVHIDATEDPVNRILTVKVKSLHQDGMSLVGSP
jgi:hypothetical protein